jgi:hypothetical protein
LRHRAFGYDLSFLGHRAEIYSRTCVSQGWRAAVGASPPRVITGFAYAFS